MTKYEKIMLELDVVKTIAYAEGDSFTEKIHNAICVLEDYAKREKEKEQYNERIIL